MVETLLETAVTTGKVAGKDVLPRGERRLQCAPVFDYRSKLKHGFF